MNSSLRNGTKYGTNCSLKLIQLLVSYEQEKLIEINTKKEELQKEKDKLPTQQGLDVLFDQMHKNLTEVENSIMKIKKNKFERDIKTIKSIPENIQN